MLKRVILLVCDGLGDRPLKQLRGLTPLENANTPHLDRLARESECGLMHTLGRGQTPGSDTAHLAIFGNRIPEDYSGRGPIEVAGLRLQLEHGDVALRGNLGTVDDELMIKDRRAGRIRAVEPFTTALDGMEVDGVTFVVKPGTAHRAGVIMRGDGLSDEIIDADPHKPDMPVRVVTPTRDTPEAIRTADVLNRFLAQAHEVLKAHPENARREAAGDLAANYLLVRGAGQYRKVPSFQERYGLKPACVAGGGLYKGVGAFLGMDILDVPGATALPDTDIGAKFKVVMKALDSYQFVFVHVKAADSLGEDGNFEGKRDFIEKMDRAIPILADHPDDTLLIVTADHSTPCELKAHSGDPVPILFHGSSVRVDSVEQFGERSCSHGGLGYIVGNDVMRQTMCLLGTLSLIGA